MNRIKTPSGFFRGALIAPICIILLYTVFGCTPKSSVQPDFSQIESGFKNIPDTVLTSVYWYWLSDNISKEGVVKDLKAMKSVGINRAFIGNIGLNGTTYGKVKIFTDEWWDILHTALKTATELNIQIGIFNSPGWSQSGGPWIKPEQSMRYLNSSEILVKGPLKFKDKLDAPNTDFQRVKVIAFRMPSGYGADYKSLKPGVTSQPKMAYINRIVDGDTVSFKLSPNNPLTIDFKTEVSAVVRTLIIRTAHKPIKARGEFYAGENGTYRKLSDFIIDRSNPNLIVGFNPYAPVVISVPETNCKDYRIVFSNANPAGAISSIDLSATPEIERYPEKSLAKMFQTPLPYWHDYMWPVQPEITDSSLLINPQKVIDLTNNLSSDGLLTWDVPEGNWIIMQSGMTSTGVKNEPASPEGTGLEADKMSRKHIAFHFDAYLGEIIRRIPEEDRKTWKVVVEDSYERGGQNWTDGFIDEFTAKYGYSPVPFIPVLKGYVVGSRDISDRFLWDLRRIVADKIAYDYVGGLREVSHKNGLTTWLENYGHWGFPGEFLQYGGQSDEVGGEFWSEGELGNIENRAASSCAHTYGKRKVSAESFTCAGAPFSRYPALMKPRGDRFFTEGINNTLLHVYIEQPTDSLPGENAWFGNEFNRHNTWFSQMDLFTSYLKRADFMLQQGNYVADVAYYIGEDVPKMTGICDPALPKGYSFDYINSEVIRDRMTVKDGKLLLPDGMAYRILVLPKLETMRPEMIKKISELVNQGAIVLGPAPLRSPSLQNYPGSDQQVKMLASQLWGNVDGIKVKSARVGKGMILSGMEMKETLDLIKVVPDCKFDNPDNALFIHRKTSDGEFYFITNQSDTTININPEFRISGRRPEFWDATSGSIRELPAYTIKEETTIVPLKLEAYESAFIVFRKKGKSSSGTGVNVNFPDPKIIAELNGIWSVAFDASMRGPAKPVTFTSLYDWTASASDSVKYYSGTAVYKKSFNLDQGSLHGKIFADLGVIKDIARVKLNGKDLGGVWTAPYRIDISSAIKPGENVLEVSVANTWVNRLVGDSRLPVSERRTWCSVNIFKPENPLSPSGLLGPVRIVSYN